MMLLDPMPDEIAAGYQGRLGELHGWKSQRKSLAELRIANAAQGLETGGSSPLYELASAARMSVEAFARLHTLLPVMNVASDFGAGIPHGSRLSGKGGQHGMRGIGGRPRVCRDCILEDINHWGFSWYRRAHQIQGVDWCDKHGCALLWIDSLDPFSASPHGWFAGDVCRETEEFWVTASGAPPLLHRYSAVCLSFLDRGAPAPSRLLNAMVAHRVLNQGLNLASLQDRIKDQAPAGWLAQNFPDLSSCHSLGPTPIGRLLRRPSHAASGYHYALLIALLWERVDDALATLFARPRAASAAAVRIR